MVLEVRIHKVVGQLVKPPSVLSFRILVETCEEDGVLVRALVILYEVVVAHVHELAKVGQHGFRLELMPSVLAAGLDDVYLAEVVPKRRI